MKCYDRFVDSFPYRPPMDRDLTQRRLEAVASGLAVGARVSAIVTFDSAALPAGDALPSERRW